MEVELSSILVYDIYDQHDILYVVMEQFIYIFLKFHKKMYADFSGLKMHKSTQTMRKSLFILRD